MIVVAVTSAKLVQPPRYTWSVGYTTAEVPFDEDIGEYPAKLIDVMERACPSRAAYGANEIEVTAKMFPTKNEAYPRLTVDWMAQKTFFANAPFIRIIDESSPVIKVVVVWNIHTAPVTLRALSVK